MSTRTSGTEKVEHEGPDEQMDERYQRSSEGMMLHMQRSSPPCVNRRGGERLSKAAMRGRTRPISSGGTWLFLVSKVFFIRGWFAVEENSYASCERY
jgi:hypothetical protein